MRFEEHIVTEQLRHVDGRGMVRYPNRHPGRPGSLVLPVAGSVLWLDAADYSTLTLANGGRISQINDKSGAGANAAQATQANRPRHVVRSTVFNQLGLMDFSKDHLTSSVSASDRSCTTFVAGMIDNLTDDYRTIMSGSSAGARQFRFEQNTGKFGCVRQNVVNLFSTTTLAVTPGVPFVLVVALTATTWEVRLTGATTETGSESTAFGAGLTTAIGYNLSSGAERWMGPLAEVVIYDTTLSSGDIDLVVAYLRAKWGI